MNDLAFKNNHRVIDMCSKKVRKLQVILDKKNCFSYFLCKEYRLQDYYLSAAWRLIRENEEMIKDEERRIYGTTDISSTISTESR